MRKIVLSIFAVLAVSFSAVAQNQQVSGTVRDADGAPIIGANVIVTNTTTGISTGVDGSYTIQVPANGSLTFTYLGKITQIVDVNRRSVIDIVMEDDSKVIDDVIVTAFGESSRTTFTGAYAEVGEEQLAKRASTNAINTLAGTMPGVQLRASSGQPGSEASIRIRGQVSMYASNSPLIVLDGAVYNGGFSSINSADIESMTVLKDAASAALYGARAASGVIMVTTKKGKSGEARIFVDARLGVGTREQKPYDLIRDPKLHYETLYSSLYDYYYGSQGYSANDAWTTSNGMLEEIASYIVYDTGGNPMIDRDGKLQDGATLGRLYPADDGNQYFITPDDWDKEAYKASLRQEYTVNVTSGNERSSFFGSVSYLNEEGIISSSNFERITARINSDYKAKSWFKVGGNVGFANTATSYASGAGEGTGSSGNIFAFTQNIAPIFPVYIRDADKKILVDEMGWNVYDYGGAFGGLLGRTPGVKLLDSNGNALTRALLSSNNPIQSIMLDKQMSNTNRVNISGFAEVAFMPELKLRIEASDALTESRQKSTSNPYYGTTGPELEGVLSLGHYRDQTISMVQRLNYDKTFGKHTVSAMVGHEFSRMDSWGLSAMRDHMYSPEILELDAYANDRRASSSSHSVYMVEGFFLRATYDYDQRYFATFSFRRDASSYFAPENQWGNFWSISGGWIVSSEEFMRDLTWIDQLKFRASLGQVGNDQIGAYRYASRYSLEIDGTQISTLIQSPGAREITWETNTSFNVGLDFSLFNNRLNGTIEYYQRTTYDLLAQVPVPESSGYRRMWSNVGDMRNRGFELDLRAVVLQGNNYSLELFGNITTNKSVYLKLVEGDLKLENKTGYSSGDKWLGIGSAVDTYYLPRYAGVNEYGQSLYYTREGGKNEGEINGVTTDHSVAGDFITGKSAQPDAFGGFGLNFQAYGFDISVNFDYQIGGYVYDDNYQSFMGSPTGPMGSALHVDVLKSWTTNNTGSNLPRYQYLDRSAAEGSDRFLTSASYLNLGNINVGYTLPSKWTKSIGVNSLRIYAVVENINYWSARRGMDPRMSWSGGVANANYSPIRTFSGGLQLTF